MADLKTEKSASESEGRAASESEGRRPESASESEGRRPQNPASESEGAIKITLYQGGAAYSVSQAASGGEQAPPAGVSDLDPHRPSSRKRPPRLMPYSTNPMAEQDGAPRLEIVCRAVEVATDGDIANYGLALALKIMRRLTPAEREMVAAMAAQLNTGDGKRPDLARGAVAEKLSRHHSQNSP